MKTEIERTEDNVAEGPEVIETHSAPNTSKIEVNEEEPPREKVKTKTKNLTLKHPKIIGIEIPIHSVFLKIYINPRFDANAIIEITKICLNWYSLIFIRLVFRNVNSNANAYRICFVN